MVCLDDTNGDKDDEDHIFETPPKSNAKKGQGVNQGGRGASMSWSLDKVGVEVLVFLMVNLILEI